MWVEEASSCRVGSDWRSLFALRLIRRHSKPLNTSNQGPNAERALVNCIYWFVGSFMHSFLPRFNHSFIFIYPAFWSSFATSLVRNSWKIHHPSPNCTPKHSTFWVNFQSSCLFFPTRPHGPVFWVIRTNQGRMWYPWDHLERQQVNTSKNRGGIYVLNTF